MRRCHSGFRLFYPRDSGKKERSIFGRGFSPSSLPDGSAPRSSEPNGPGWIDSLVLVDHFSAGTGRRGPREGAEHGLKRLIRDGSALGRANDQSEGCFRGGTSFFNGIGWRDRASTGRSHSAESAGGGGEARRGRHEFRRAGISGSRRRCSCAGSRNREKWYARRERRTWQSLARWPARHRRSSPAAGRCCEERQTRDSDSCRSACDSTTGRSSRPPRR